MSDIEFVRVEVDYQGNVYLRFRDICYNIFFDSSSETGIRLDRISDTNGLISLLKDHPHLAKYVKKGKIVLSDITLKGRVTQIMSKMDSDEYDEHAEKNSFTTYDSSFKESDFFRIERIELDESGEDYDDWDIVDTEEAYTTNSEIEYRFSGISDYENPNSPNEILADGDSKTLKFSHPIMFSNMLNDTFGYNDTIMIKGDIESKLVVSNVQKTDGYCTRRLVFYTDGVCKVQYPNTHTIYSKIVYADGTLNLESIKKIDESRKNEGE